MNIVINIFLYVTDGICHDTPALICDSLNVNDKRVCSIVFTGIHKICLFITIFFFGLKFNFNGIFIFKFLVFFVLHQINDFLIKKYLTRLDVRDKIIESVQTTTTPNETNWTAFYRSQWKTLTYFEWNIFECFFFSFWTAF